ncbi:replication protein A 70 kDa DNA-binding subunit B [Tanacetum coccineum]|uniref:Replication protein A 70 kDa DNA-binding subunit B n=1 Tax=Tanacetum coccineum TaxID=301880 RepID=A0ABQ5GCR0_9ASTR
MELNMTQLCDIDPMLDDLKVLARCISLWKYHPAGYKNISKFQLLIDEGSCYRIGNFGVGDNGGKYPLLNHRYKMNFFKNTTITRVADFDNNTRGFKFEPFANFTTRQFSESDVVDVIGTVVSMSDCIPFNIFGVDKIRRTLILKDVDSFTNHKFHYVNEGQCLIPTLISSRYSGDHKGKGVIVSLVTPEEHGSNEVVYWVENSDTKYNSVGTIVTYKYYNYSSRYIHHCTITNPEVRK